MANGNWFDLGNAVFEFVGAIMNWLNVVAIYKAKEAKGVHWGSVGFFASWGLWNMVYYPALGQWVSFTAGFFIVSANLTWVTLYWYYRSTDGRKRK